jgi:methylglutaconyl-CoA hydratase
VRLTGNAAALVGRVRICNAPSALRISFPVRRSVYSTDSSSANTGPIIRVTDIPAPSSGHIRILELNRPAARNAISRALLYSLREEIDAVHAQYDAATGHEVPQPSWQKRFGGVAGEDQKGPTRALIIASAVDTSFCAGADLKERKGFTQEE